MKERGPRKKLRPGDLAKCVARWNVYAQNRNVNDGEAPDWVGMTEEGACYTIIACRVRNNIDHVGKYPVCYISGNGLSGWVIETFMERVNTDKKRRKRNV